MNDIKSRFNNLTKPLLLDGAMGSILQSNVEYVDTPLWTTLINIKNPDSVIELHKQYIKAGADIITANTFRTNPTSIKLSGVNYSSKELVKSAVEIAKQARDNSNVLINGSNAPAEDCYQSKRTLSRKELEENHIEQIDSLMMSGVDFILHETFSHFDEIKIASEYCSKNDYPYVLSLFVNNDLTILSGESIIDILKFAKQFNPLAILINCVPPTIYKNIFTEKVNVDGFYLNCGSGEYSDKEISCGIDAKSYSENVKPFLNSNLKIIGSCCGSSPKHTKLLREMIDELY